MDWISIIMAGCIGGVSALIACLFIRDRKKNKIAFGVVIGICFILLSQVSTRFVLPYFLEHRYEQQADEALQKIPVYTLIKENEPDTYANILEEVRRSIQNGQDPSHAIGRVRSAMSGLLGKYALYSSDSAAIRILEVLLEALRQLSEESPDLCYQYLFPGRSGASVDIREYVDSKTIQEELDAMYDFLSSAMLNPQVPPDQEMAEELTGELFVELHNLYGDDAAMLADPYSSNVDKETVCELAVAMYTEILTMPEQDSGPVLRYLFSTE